MIRRFPQFLKQPQTGLLALNGVLAVALAVVTLSPPADAQRERRMGEYTMIEITARGVDDQGVIIIDTESREMVTLSYDVNKRRLETLAHRDFAKDADENTRGQRR